MCIGLTVAFREAANSQGALGKWLADNQYSAYFWHPLLIVPLQMAALGIPASPLGKFALVTVVGVAVVFAWELAVPPAWPRWEGDLARLRQGAGGGGSAPRALAPPR